MKLYDISVVVPIYNVERYLRRCIESLLQKSELKYEIILVNDGSTDSSESIAKEYEERFSNISLIRKSNGGLSDARNFGLEAAKGKYVLFVDSDDYIENGLYDALKEYMLESPDCIIFQHDINGDADIVSLQLKTEHTYTGQELLEELFKQDRQFVQVMKYLYKKEFLDGNHFKFTVGLIHEDEVWTLSILLKAKKCRFCNYVGYHYEMREGSIMTSKSINHAYAYIRVANELEQKIKQQEITSQWLKKRMSKQIAAFYIQGARQIITNKRKELYRMLKDNLYLHKYSVSVKQKIAFFYIFIVLLKEKLLTKWK